MEHVIDCSFVPPGSTPRAPGPKEIEMGFHPPDTRPDTAAAAAIAEPPPPAPAEAIHPNPGPLQAAKPAKRK